ncbi:hypothetical protein ACTNDN_06640 [Niallia sp. HCP3S3_B10]|uniref:hypothetical protein n=1 Tax=Niallia sp. HCP3S3_B10 TaxID=3438944 RepID=UPI003F8CEE6C
MRKISLFITITLLSFSLLSTNVLAKLSTEEEAFINKITNDFVKTHSLNLNEYSLFDIRELNNESLQAKEQSLLNISLEITKNQSFIDCSPIYYLNKLKSKGYVLEKKLNGMNNLYTLTYDETNKNWLVTKKTNIMGTDLVDLGLLKGSK